MDPGNKYSTYQVALVPDVDDGKPNACDINREAEGNLMDGVGIRCVRNSLIEFSTSV